MLQAMREGAKSPIMKAFLIFLAGGFALWGIGDITSGSFGSGDKAVSAGDKSFSTQEAAIEFDRARRNLGGGISIGEALQTPLLNEVMGSLSRKALFSAEADRLGLTVTRDMQTQAIRQERAFQDEFGEFTEGRFLQTLGQIGLNEQEYLARLTETLERDQIMGAVSAAAFYPINAAKELAAFQLEDRQAQFVSFNVLPDAIDTPSDSTLAVWYDENSASFDAPVLRQFNAIILDPAVMEKDVTLREEDVVEAFDLRRDEFITPETRQLQQMVFDTQEDAQSAIEALSDADFAAVAADKLNLTDNDINLGNLRQSALDPVLADAAFAAAEGDVVGPIETAFGFHLIQVGTITAGGESTLEDVRDTLEARLRAEAALDLVFDKANELEDILGTGASLAEAASQVGADVTSLAPVDINGLTIDGEAPENALSSDSNFLSIGWELFEDEISVLAETGEATFFVVQLVEETEAAPRALADVKDRAISDYKLQKAVIAAKLAADTAQNTELAFSEADEATFKRSGTGLDHPAANLIAAKAFELSAGESAVIETGDAAILIRTEAILPAPQEEVDALADQLTGSFARTIQSDWTSALALQLSEDFDLTINSEAVRLLLVQSSQ
ncbi:MAG: SurA N-terminal domain-containing protein [Candidatus Puniceispirillaceae bacterium]